MIIKHNNFEIKVGVDSFDLYHIRLPKKRPSHKKVGNQVKVCIGYFSDFSRLLQKMVQVELANKEEIVDLRSYIELYRNVSEEFKTAMSDGKE